MKTGWLPPVARLTIVAVSFTPMILKPLTDAKSLRIAIVVSRYNASITDQLQAGAIGEFQRLGGDAKNLLIVEAPGVFELPALARAAAPGRNAVVALGCVIRGKTRHHAVLESAVAASLQRVGADTGVPVTFGILTVDTIEQAQRRAQPYEQSCVTDKENFRKTPVHNKGAEAMFAAVQTASVIEQLRAHNEDRS